MLEKITRVLKASKLYQSRSSTTLANNTTKTLDLTVPNGKKWIVHLIMMHNGDDVSRNVEAQILDGDGNFLGMIGARTGVGAGVSETIPRVNVTSNYIGGFGSIMIKGGNKIRLVWYAGGASSGGTAYYCVTYEEMLE